MEHFLSGLGVVGRSACRMICNAGRPLTRRVEPFAAGDVLAPIAWKILHRSCR